MTEHHSCVRSARKVSGFAPDQFQEHATSYLLSPSGQIVDVGGDWDQYAWENDGLDATADFVVGRHLTDFLAGFETISFFNAIAFHCRRNHASFEMVSRCDAPSRLNLFRLRIAPARDGLLKISNDLLLSRAVPVANAMDMSCRHVEAARCSMCCSYKIGRHWVDPLSQSQTTFHISRHVICPDCKARARDAMRRAKVPKEQALSIVS